MRQAFFIYINFIELLFLLLFAHFNRMFYALNAHIEIEISLLTNPFATIVVFSSSVFVSRLITMSKFIGYYNFIVIFS